MRYIHQIYSVTGPCANEGDRLDDSTSPLCCCCVAGRESRLQSCNHRCRGLFFALLGVMDAS